MADRVRRVTHGWLVRFAARERERRQRVKEEMHEGMRRRRRENPQ